MLVEAVKSCVGSKDSGATREGVGMRALAGMLCGPDDIVGAQCPDGGVSVMILDGLGLFSCAEVEDSSLSRVVCSL